MITFVILFFAYIYLVGKFLDSLDSKKKWVEGKDK